MPDEAPEIEAHALTDTGQVRQDNQDAVRCCHPNDDLTVRHGHLYGVADGMGGFAHGGIASAFALEALFKALAVALKRALKRRSGSARASRTPTSASTRWPSAWGWGGWAPP